MVLYVIFSVAVLNLGLGFALAVRVGRRHRELVALASQPVASAQEAAPSVALQSATASTTTVDEEDAPPVKEPWAATEELEGLLGGTAGPTGSSDASACEPPPEEKPDSDTTSPETEISSSQGCLQQLLGGVTDYQKELGRVDDGLRSLPETPEPAEVKAHADSLKRASEAYLQSCQETKDTFRELGADGQESHEAHETLHASLEQHGAQIRDSNHLLENVDCDTDPMEGCRQVLKVTTKLVRANDGLRDTLEEADVAVTRNERRLESMDAEKRTDPLTEVSSRVGLEAALAEWWEKDPHRARELNVAMIDMDEFARLNERYGREACDRILRAAAQLLTAESRNYSLAARYSGQRFLMLFPDTDLRFTTNAVERIRQTIEMARLDYRGQEIRVTVSCAVTEATPEDTSSTLYARAEATLREAKRYGRNRTFLHEGKYPTPVVPPNFTLEEKSIAL